MKALLRIHYIYTYILLLYKGRKSKLKYKKNNNKIVIYECVSVDLFHENKFSSKPTSPDLEIISKENEKEQNVSGRNKIKTLIT